MYRLTVSFIFLVSFFLPNILSRSITGYEHPLGTTLNRVEEVPEHEVVVGQMIDDLDGDAADDMGENESLQEDHQEAPVDEICLFCVNEITALNKLLDEFCILSCGHSVHKDCLLAFFQEHTDTIEEGDDAFEFVCNAHEGHSEDVVFDLQDALDADLPVILFGLLQNQNPDLTPTSLVDLGADFFEGMPFWLLFISRILPKSVGYLYANNIPFLHHTFDNKNPIEWAHELGFEGIAQRFSVLRDQGRCIPIPLPDQN